MSTHPPLIPIPDDRTDAEKAGLCTDYIEVPGGRLYRTWAVYQDPPGVLHLSLDPLPVRVASAISTTFVPDPPEVST